MPYEPWRYACPNGHASWKPMKDGYKCNQCGTHFDELSDVKHDDVQRPTNRGANGHTHENQEATL